MLLGNSEAGIEGLFDLSGVLSYTIPADGTGSSQRWSTKAPARILRDMTNLANTPINTTNGVEMVRRIILPINQFTLIANTARSDNSDTTILEYFKRNNPNVEVVWASKLSGILGSGNGERMIGYSPDRRLSLIHISEPRDS